jgi:CRP-like cAMP-binding protein
VCGIFDHHKSASGIEGTLTDRPQKSEWRQAADLEWHPPERHPDCSTPLSPPPTSVVARASRWAVIRDALSNPNIARAEASIAIGTVAHVAWNATMLVTTFDRLGPIGPGLYVLVTQLALAIGAPVLAALAGRFRRERVLAGAMIANGVGIALVIPVLELHAASALLFLPTAVEGFTRAAPSALHDALLPWLANSPAQLVAANALSGILDTTAVLVGAGVTAVGLWLSGPCAVVTVVATLVAVGAGPLLAIRGIDTRVGHDGSRIRNELAGGIGVLRRLPNARAVVIVMAVAAAIGGFEQSNATSVATEIVHIGANGTPVLVGAVAVGGIIGGIASLSLSGRRFVSVPLAVGLLACAFALSALTVTSAKALTLALVSVAGIGVAYQAVCSHTLLQRSASGRALDLLVGINALIGVSISGVSAFCAGELNAAIGVRGSLRVAAGLAVLGAVYALWRLTRSERLSPISHEEIDVVNNVEAFGPLSVAAANQLAAALVSSQAAAGDVIVRQGDPAEDMFLISSGVFEADVGGKRIRTMHQGNHFGEVAVLFEAPRTATVRCLEAGALWRLSREDFLRAVTGNSTTKATMKAIADQRLADAGEVDKT